MNTNHKGRESSMRYGRNHHTCVPVEVLRDILEREYPDRPMTDIAAELGVDERTVARVLRPDVAGAVKYVTHSKVDRFLTRLGMTHLWHTHPGLIEVGEYLDGHAALAGAA